MMAKAIPMAKAHPIWKMDPKAGLGVDGRPLVVLTSIWFKKVEAEDAIPG